MFNFEVFVLGVARDLERFFRVENNFKMKKRHGCSTQKILKLINLWSTAVSATNIANT